MKSRKKVSIIGAGNIGSTIAHIIAKDELADVVMLDVVDGMPQGKALDLLEASPIDGSDINITGSTSYEDTAGSDVTVITAGITRKPGMSRDDLLATNAGIIKSVTENCVKYSPRTKIIVVSNPLDVMAYLAYKVSGLPAESVMGMAGVLDSARFCTFVAKAVNVSVRDVSALVLGGHGDSMIPLVRYCTVGGIPVTNFLTDQQIEEIVKRTRFAGGEIVEMLNTSAYYSPAISAVMMVKAILLDKKRIVTCAAYLNGEYGLIDVFIGVPVVLGHGGVEKIIQVDLTSDEKKALHGSAESIKSLIGKVI